VDEGVDPHASLSLAQAAAYHLGREDLVADDPSPIVGIDLGTTNSSVAVFRDGKVVVLPNALGELLTPSVVAIDPNGGLLVGRTAKEIYALHPERGAALFKRTMGTDVTYPLLGARYGSVDLSALILASLKADAERALNGSVRRCVVTVPAYFDESQRFATMKAGELAGLDVVRILNEPTAAAIAYGLHRRATDGTLLVLDLGGGTFDVCVMDLFEGALEVRSVAGESLLGGEDFTRRLAALVLDRVGAQFERVELLEPEVLGLLLRHSELAKRALSSADTAVVTVPPIRSVTNEPTDVNVTRAEAEESWQSLLARLEPPRRTAIKSAALNREDVDVLLFVGGATRTPCVATLFRRLFGKEPLSGVDPDLAVAHGAAIQAALIGQDHDVRDFVVTDVASHSLGVGISKQFGSKREPGFFLPIIHRNSVIPTTQSTEVETVEPNQTVLHLHVYEGESRMVKDNRLLGSLKVTGIPRGPAGQPVTVRMTFDLNGILEVEAVVLDTGKVFTTVLTRNSKSLSAKELEAAASRLARIKVDPHDRPRVRDVKARAELLLREVEAQSRTRLEETLDALETAIAERDETAIARWTALLERLCKDVDGDERW
jgi:molecular chaperone HscC